MIRPACVLTGYEREETVKSEKIAQSYRKVTIFLSIKKNCQTFKNIIRPENQVNKNVLPNNFNELFANLSANLSKNFH